MQVWKRLLQKEKGRKNKEQQKLSGAGCFPKKLSSLGLYKTIPGSWQDFPSSDINFRDG